MRWASFSAVSCSPRYEWWREGGKGGRGNYGGVWGGRGRKGKGGYPVEMDIDAAVGVEGGGFAMKGGDFAEEADGVVFEGFEVFGVDAGGGF